MKKYILIAGVNGAGKSTLYQTLESLKNMPRINTDEIVKSFGNWQNMYDVLEAGKIAVKKIKEYFQQGVTFNQETTLCGASINIAQERIAYRVSQGGHGIPDVDVERRYAESFKRLKEIVSLCDLVVLYDNSEVFNRFAIYQDGKLFDVSDNRPDWYNELNI